MDAYLFFLGALGALITVYLYKQVIIPEFRPLFDISEMLDEKDKRIDHIESTRKELDRLQAELEKNSMNQDSEKRLKFLICSTHKEIAEETKRLETLEHTIKRGQYTSRGLGFLVYIILGGVFGALLAGKVEIEGWTGDLPNYFQSLLIGATWTSYLSVIGFKTIKDKTDKELESAKKKAAEKFKTLEKDLTQKVKNQMEPKKDKVKAEYSPLTVETASIVTEEIAKASKVVQENMDKARDKIRKDLSRFP